MILFLNIGLSLASFATTDVILSNKSGENLKKLNSSTNVILEGCSALLSTVPFGIDHDTDVVFKMFKDPNQDISLNKFETNLGDITMKILTRSAIVKDE